MLRLFVRIQRGKDVPAHKTNPRVERQALRTFATPVSD